MIVRCLHKFGAKFQLCAFWRLDALVAGMNCSKNVSSPCKEVCY